MIRFMQGDFYRHITVIFDSYVSNKMVEVSAIEVLPSAFYCHLQIFACWTDFGIRSTLARVDIKLHT